MFKRKNSIAQSHGDRALTFVFHVFIVCAVLCSVLPFILVISSSLTDEITLVKYGYTLFPKKFSLDAYKLVCRSKEIFSAYGVTFVLTVAGTALSMLLTCGVAYAMSVKSFRNRSRLALFIYFTMLFGGGLVSSYLLIAKYLDMKNTFWVLMLPSLLSPYNILLMRNFFQGLPDSLAESAKIDGANDISILFKIILPISLPGIATIGLFYALGYWNEWYKVMLYIDDEKLYTLQWLIVRIMRKINYAASMEGSNSLGLEVLPSYSFRMAAVVATIGPIIFLYPFLQKYFVSGLTVGSVKG